MKPDWTNEETNAAKSLRDSGVPYATIGERLGRSAKGVRRRLEHLREMSPTSETDQLGGVGV